MMALGEEAIVPTMSEAEPDVPETTPEPADPRVAFHEAGHAVAALALGRNVQRVSIVPKLNRLGQCDMQKGMKGAYRDMRENDCLILLAGLAAEAAHTGRYAWGGAAQDLRDVERLIRHRFRNERQADRALQRLLDKTEHLLADDAHRRAVETIANELLAKETISGRAARHLFEEARRSVEGS